MEVAVDLLVDRRRREAVAGVLAPEPAGEVDVLAAVDVPDACAFRAVDDERVVATPRATYRSRSATSRSDVVCSLIAISVLQISEDLVDTRAGRSRRAPFR